MKITTVYFLILSISITLSFSQTDNIILLECDEGLSSNTELLRVSRCRNGTSFYCNGLCRDNDNCISCLLQLKDYKITYQNVIMISSSSLFHIFYLSNSVSNKISDSNKILESNKILNSNLNDIVMEITNE
jgi:hypothetical protein